MESNEENSMKKDEKEREKERKKEKSNDGKKQLKDMNKVEEAKSKDEL
ncbi:unnamed protein product [Brugia timori]|uniref:Uncharacterized protein n=1 Tax=Brugia timori TaxID=42155 RepID=A0A3P7VPD3_9BILA|nr:unnamed protein product [Brugia timori]